jgi:SEC-C motif-containing protein
MTSTCPCGRVEALGALSYERCCGRHLDDPSAPPPTPEALMRSRYTAYVLGRVDWLLATWDPARRPRTIDLEPGVRWTGLEIRSSTQDGDTGRVDFAARWSDAQGGRGVLREDSRFERRQGRWFYVDGVVR